jgi:putative endonuclease
VSFVVDVEADLQVGLECAIARGMPKDARQSLGKIGENLACRELRRLGYEILARRYRTRFGEIDIVAKHETAIVFVEVKSRAGDQFGGAAAAVTAWKQRRIADMAVDFLARRRLADHPCRFDVVTVDFGSGKPRVQVYSNAFVA